jgi:xanthine dehydrogenase accessory factor
MSLKNNYLKIGRFLEQGRPLVWARIIRLDGSGPRSVGADCLVLNDGTLIGTIGGGTLEHVIIEKAKKMMGGAAPEVVHFRMHGEDVNQSEMLCGGEVDVLLDPLNPERKEVLSIFSAAGDLIEKRIRAAFISSVPESNNIIDGSNCRMLATAETVVSGSIPAFSLPLSELSRLSSPTLWNCPETGALFYIAPLECAPELLIFGAGHISTCIAPIAKMVGFRVAIIDDRTDFANRERFPVVDDIYVQSFDRALREIPTSFQTYIVIVTRGHKYDKVILEAMLDKPHAYIGMIGSRQKRDTIYRAFMNAGISPETLSQVYSPIGLDIGAETPEEIAVSIIAELIDVRATKKVGAALPKPQFAANENSQG